MNTLVQARVNQEVKEQAALVLQGMGLSVSDAVRIVLTRTAKEGRFPLELVPNALTAETLEKSARGEDIHKAKDAKDLFAQLGI